jgi:hypothetical protein
MELKGIVRALQKVTAGAPRVFRMTEWESQAIAQVEDPKLELSRAGRRFYGGNSIIANGIAPVAAIPTTTATLELYNSADAGGVSLVIDRIGFWLGSGTAAAGATLFAAVSPSVIATAATANATGYATGSASGSTRASKAFWATAATFPAGTVWTQVTSTFQLAAANVGQGDSYVEFSGALVVRPKHALGFAILSGAGTSPLYGISASWAEMPLTFDD